MRFPHRRTFLHLAAGAAALPAVARIARAQAYPSRPVRIVVGFAAAGGNDIVARIMGQWLSEKLGQQFIIENRPGAGTNIATEATLRAPSDGYTLFLASPASAINATLYQNLSFNFIRDSAPVAGITSSPILMVVHPSVRAKTVAEFIAYAKANPGKVNMASAGNGSSGHVSGELFKMMAGVDLVHVPYRGNGPALTDVLGGQVQVLFPSAASAIEFVRAGTLRGLASRPRSARRHSRTFRRSTKQCRATRRSNGMALSRRGIRPLKSWIGSTRRSMQDWPIPP